MSFGYSVGDVIAGANLTYRLIRIMADTKGGSVEYLEAMSELSGMQQAFLQIGQIRSHEMLPPATVNAASHIVLGSMDIIAKFLERSKHYQRQLENPRASTFQGSWYKVGWSLYKSHELRALRDALHSRLTSIQVLLSAASYCTPLPTTLAQYRVTDQKLDTRSTSEQSSVIPSPSESGSSDSVVAYTAATNSKGAYSSLSTPAQNDATIPTTEGGAMRQFISFKDAVGRKFRFPFHKCKKWVDMADLIKQAFLHVDVLGPHVMEGHYDVIGEDGTSILPSIWEDIVEPELSVFMTLWPIDNLQPPVPSPKLPLPPQARPPQFYPPQPYPTIHPPPSHPTAYPPLPHPTTHLIAPEERPIPGGEGETRAGSREPRQNRHRPDEARNFRDSSPVESVTPQEEFTRRLRELNPITKPGAIGIIKDMESCSKITQVQSRKAIKVINKMSRRVFKDDICAFQAEWSSRQADSESSLSEDSSHRKSWELTSVRDVIRNRAAEGHSQVSTADGDNGTDSDSEDWEDYTDDEENILENKRNT
ncbi:ABC transporter transmembrane domain type 1 [Fusarium albosuccineum]|uniref:ABC transporter transmembrane domain type 1 n=1 Tax=Fusarium albosuccineum TaxID=1237068 RepID=A0A8H4PA41_9HYPO|nr:ABC transporter transmembrane domain type 1 [Fusarium albosuccineum]